VVERLPRKRKALGSVPSSEKKNQKKKKKKKKDRTALCSIDNPGTRYGDQVSLCLSNAAFKGVRHHAWLTF